MVRCIACHVLHMRQFCRFLYCVAWFDTVEFNRLPCPNNKIYDDTDFAYRFRYQLAMFGIRVLTILTLSCSYCICNRYWQNHRCILPNFLLFAWFDTLEFNCLPSSNNKICDDAVFADRFRYHWTMFGMGILIRLSRLLNTHIAYETAI